MNYRFVPVLFFLAGAFVAVAPFCALAGAFFAPLRALYFFVGTGAQAPLNNNCVRFFQNVKGKPSYAGRKRPWRSGKKQHNSIITYCNSYHYVLICKGRIALYKNGHNNNGCNRIIKSHSVSSAIAHRVTVFLCSQLPIYSGCVLYRAQHIAVTYSGRCGRASTWKSARCAVGHSPCGRL